MSQEESQEGDAEVGRLLFISRCQTCHTIEPGGKQLAGPNLHRIMGRKAGIVPNYHYSDANKRIGIPWTRETMDQFLENPVKFMPGTKMQFPLIKEKEQRNDIIAYLEEMSI